MQLLDTSAQLDAVLAAPVALLFKHSSRCPVSSMAHDEVRRLLRERDGTTAWLVDVIGRRALSREVAERTGVQHESPQVLVLARGAVVYVASHFDVRADELARELEAADDAAVSGRAPAQPAPSSTRAK